MNSTLRNRFTSDTCKCMYVSMTFTIHTTVLSSNSFDICNVSTSTQWQWYEIRWWLHQCHAHCQCMVIGALYSRNTALLWCHITWVQYWKNSALLWRHKSAVFLEQCDNVMTCTVIMSAIWTVAYWCHKSAVLLKTWDTEESAVFTWTLSQCTDITMSVMILLCSAVEWWIKKVVEAESCDFLTAANCP